MKFCENVDETFASVVVVVDENVCKGINQCNVTDTISWRGHHDRAMQFVCIEPNVLYFVLIDNNSDKNLLLSNSEPQWHCRLGRSVYCINPLTCRVLDVSLISSRQGPNQPVSKFLYINIEYGY